MVKPELVHESIEAQLAAVEAKIESLKAAIAQNPDQEIGYDLQKVNKVIAGFLEDISSGYQGYDTSTRGLYLQHLEQLQSDLEKIAKIQIESILKDSFLALSQVFIQRIAWVFGALLTPTEGGMSLQYQVIDGIPTLSISNEQGKDTLFTVDSDLEHMLFFTLREEGKLVKYYFATEDESDFTQQNAADALEIFLDIIIGKGKNSIQISCENAGLHFGRRELVLELDSDDLGPDRFYYSRMRRIFSQGDRENLE